MKNINVIRLLLLILSSAVLSEIVVAGGIELDIYKEIPTMESISRTKRQLHEHKDHWRNDSVTVYKYMNGEYYGLIGVGSPAKTFKVIFDTTWADSWLPSSHCAWTEIACKIHNQYDSSKSSTYISNDKFVNISDAEFSLNGFLSTDTFHLAHLKVANQTFIEATHLSANPFLQYKADGVIGLAYQEESLSNAMPFFYNMIFQNLIEKNIFTFYMNRDESTSKAGKVIFGGTQRSHVISGTLTTVKVVEKKFWTIEMDGLFVERNKTNYPIVQKFKANFDSSANTIVGPSDKIRKLNYMLNAIYLPKINRYTVNCRNYAKLPRIHFTLNDEDFVIESKYYVQRLTLDNVEACFSPFVPNLIPDDLTWQLGGAFMMEFYTEFDLNNNVINIGKTIF